MKQRRRKDKRKLDGYRWVDTSPYRNTLDSDTGINTIFNASIHRVLQYIAIILLT